MPDDAIQTLLAFDYGTQKIGVALGNRLTGSTRPLAIVKSTEQKKLWQPIKQLIDEWQPDALLVGLPLDNDDQEAPVAKQAKKFARQLEGRFRLPVFMINEHGTSREARHQVGAKREQIDDVAAQLILQTWLTEFGSC